MFEILLTIILTPLAIGAVILSGCLVIGTIGAVAKGLSKKK